MRASTPRAASPARSRWRARCARCWKAARSCLRTPTAAACRTRIRCAASRRSWAPASTTCAHAARVLVIEANAASDNPLVFADTGEVISGGNFHAEPVAFAADIIALAVAEVGAISERRIALLLDTGLSGLPPFLVQRRRPQLRLHDRAGHGRGAGLREQVAGASRPASTACPPRPTRKTMCRWRPTPRAAWATWSSNTAVVVGIEAHGRRAGHRTQARAEARRWSKPSSPPSARGRLPRARPLPRARHRGRCGQWALHAPTARHPARHPAELRPGGASP